jgi:hypothetical protein
LFSFLSKASWTSRCVLALLAHIVSCNAWSNFRSRSDDAKFSPTPHPEHKPNMNENRNDSKMFSALRSPPPAASGNRSSFTVQFNVCCCVGWTWCFLLCLKWCVFENELRAASL